MCDILDLWKTQILIHIKSWNVSRIKHLFIDILYRYATGLHHYDNRICFYVQKCLKCMSLDKIQKTNDVIEVEIK